MKILTLPIARIIIFALSACIIVSSLSGCTTTHTALTKSRLHTQTKMSDTIFLDPVPASQRTVYVQVRNTSPYPGMNLTHVLSNELLNKGYHVTHHLSNAHYLLQVNVRKVGRYEGGGVDQMLAAGFGGGLVGAGIGHLVGSRRNGAVVGGLVGAAVGTLASAMIRDVNYVIVTDVRVSQRSRDLVKETNYASLKQGSSGTRELHSQRNSQWERYETRVITTANRVNLKLEQVQPLLVADMAHSIAGIF